MGVCQFFGPFLGPLNTRCRIILGTPKGTIISTPSWFLLDPDLTGAFAPCLHTAEPKIKGRCVGVSKIRGPNIDPT